MEHASRAVRSIVSALDSGVAFLRVGGEDGFLLAKRRRGETIVDPDGMGEFEALSGGVFRRFRSSSGNDRWMLLGPCDVDHLTACFRRDFESLSERDLEAVALDVAFQSVRAAETARRRRSSEPAEAVGYGRGRL